MSCSWASLPSSQTPHRTAKEHEQLTHVARSSQRPWQRERWSLERSRARPFTTSHSLGRLAWPTRRCSHDMPYLRHPARAQSAPDDMFCRLQGQCRQASKALFIFICFSLFSSLLWLFIQPQLLEMDMFGGRSPLSAPAALSAVFLHGLSMSRAQWMHEHSGIGGWLGSCRCFVL